MPTTMLRLAPVMALAVSSAGVVLQLTCAEPHLRKLDTRVLHMEAALLDAHHAMLTAAAAAAAAATAVTTSYVASEAAHPSPSSAAAAAAAPAAYASYTDAPPQPAGVYGPCGYAPSAAPFTPFGSASVPYGIPYASPSSPCTPYTPPLTPQQQHALLLAAAAKAAETAALCRSAAETSEAKTAVKPGTVSTLLGMLGSAGELLAPLWPWPAVAQAAGSADVCASDGCGNGGAALTTPINI